MAGRPEYVPSQADKATVQSLIALGSTHEQIARCIGTNGISPTTLRKVFKRELETSALEVKALAMSKLVAAINLGEAWAICFFLKTKAGFHETSKHRLVDEHDKDRGLTLADIDASIEASERAKAEAQRKAG